ncbi:MAG: Bug family tripartite tricarboxylate transporter substrate binding protein [Gemmatimonas sp.]
MSAVTAAAAHAQSVDAFYKSTQVQLLVGHDAGGGYDAYTRVLAKHMQKRIPGNPSIVVKNVLGAGGLKMIDFLYHVAPRDGSIFGISDRGYIIEPMLGNKAAQFDPTKMSALGSIGRQTPTCAVWHQAKAQTLKDALATEILIGGTGPSATTIYPAILNSVVHTNFKIIPGYKGSGEIMLAIEKGEVEGVCLSWDTLKTIKPDWLGDGRLKPIVQMAIERNPEIRDVPTASEFAPSDEDRQMLAFYFGPNDIGRPYMGPPDLPNDRLTAMRRAFDATMKDPDYLAEAKAMKMDVDPMTGEDMEALIRKIYATPPRLVDRVKLALEQFRDRNAQ